MPFFQKNARYIESLQTGRGHPVDPDLQFDPVDLEADAELEGFAPGPVSLTGLPPWQCVAGETFIAAIVTPADSFTGRLGARVEAPGTRAIVSAWMQAAQSGNLYSVELESPVVPGSYEVVWITDEGSPSFEKFFPLICIPSGPSSDADTWPQIDVEAVSPTVAEIAGMEGTRARSAETGDFQNTFNDFTYPTGDQVAELISDAVNDVLAILPDVIDPEYWPRVRTAVKYLTAVLIEQSFFRSAQDPKSSGVVLTYQQRLNSVLQALSVTNINSAQRLV